MKRIPYLIGKLKNQIFTIRKQKIINSQYGDPSGAHELTCFPILLITSHYVMYIAEYCNGILN